MLLANAILPPGVLTIVTGERDIGEGMSPDEVVSLGKDVGIPERYLRQAILEEHGRVELPAPHGLLDRVHPAMREMLVWHACEEIEHKAIYCYMVTLSPNQILISIEQVLTDENYARIVNGLSRDEVRRILGKPGSIKTYMKPEEVWDWKVAGVIPTEEKHFHVHFDPATGKVLRTTSRIQPKG